MNKIKPAARLRIIGVVVLLFGIGGAALVYWMGGPVTDLSDDPSTARGYKTESRETEINFGKSGLVMNDLWAYLKRPGAEAVLLSVVAVLIASGCFYFARFQDDDAPPN